MVNTGHVVRCSPLIGRRDVFTNQDPGQFVECEEVSRMSLNPWIGECY